MDPFSQLSQLQHNLQAMTKTVAGLENDMLEVLKENTELKVENQLLREKISKLDANKEPAVMVTTEAATIFSRFFL